MIILLSPEQDIEDETLIVNTLLRRGLDLYHIRKYAFTDEQMLRYVGEIDIAYRKQLVMHSHFHLAEQLGVERLHIREADRQQSTYRLPSGAFKLSTSVHDISTFNALESTWEYAFLSPMFPSISKQGYGLTHTVLEDLALRSNTAVRLVGLGGINEQQAECVYRAGADAIGLLGAIWNSQAPIAVFEELLQKRDNRKYGHTI